MCRTPVAALIYFWTTVESSMHQARSKNIPVLPSTLQALDEMLDKNRQKFNSGNHRFFQDWIFDDQGKSHIMFGCSELVDTIIRNGETELHADGTFKVVPSRPKCGQLFIIQLIIQNHERKIKLDIC